MHLEWLRDVCSTSGPFATVLVDASHDTEDAARVAALRTRAVRDDLAGQGAPDAVLDAVDAALAEAGPPAGRAGRALVADASGVLVDVPLPEPPAAERVLWDDEPDLLAVAAAVPETVTAVVVRVDERGGELLGPDPATVTGRTDTVHKARAGGTAHWSMQHRVEETWRRNAAEVAATVDARVARTGARLLLIAGADRARARLRAELPERAARIATDVETVEEVPTAMAQATDLLLDGERREAFARWAQLAGQDGGLAVGGLAAVVAAARAAALEILFVDPATVTAARIWSGPEPTQLGTGEDEVGEGARQVSAIAALIRAATCTDAALVVLDDPDRVLGRDPLDDGAEHPESAVLGSGQLQDGLGAILRFPVS